MYAIKHYHNPSCEGINEFYDDKTKRAVYEYYQKDFNLYEALKGG